MNAEHLATTPEVRLPMPGFWSRTHAEQQAALAQLLSTRHKGRANGIGAEELAIKLGTSERFLRDMVSDARESGLAICATPTTGYFVAETAEELQECCAFLRSRALKSLRIEAQLKRIPLPDLLGQLHLTT